MNSSASTTRFRSPLHPDLTLRVLHYAAPSCNSPAVPSARSDYPSVSLLRFYRQWWCRNIYLLSIIYGFRPRLRPRLTLGGRTFPRKPETFDGGVSRPTCATYTGILSCMQSTAPLDTASARIHCSSTNCIAAIPKLRCQVLAPLIFGASSLDQ